MEQRMDIPDTPNASDQASCSKESSMGEKPACIVCLGMVGSGKATFIQVKVLIVGLYYTCRF